MAMGLFGPGLLIASAANAVAIVRPPPTPAPNPGCASTDCSASGGGTATVYSNVTGQYGNFTQNLPLSNGLYGFSSDNGTPRYALGAGDTGAAAAGAGSNWNTWLSVSQNNIAYSYQPLQSSGHANLSLVGLDYTFSNSVIVGLAAGWDQVHVGTDFNSGNITTKGHMLAPYLSWRINRSWNLDGTAGWGRSTLNQTDNSAPGGISGGTSDSRTMASLSLSYVQMVAGKWQLTGRASYLTGTDKFGQYTLSNGTTAAAANNTNAQVRVGGQAMYNGGSCLPYVGIYYYNYTQFVAAPTINGVTPANDRDGFQAQLGVQFAPKGPVYGGLMLATNFGQSQVKNDLFLANLGFRF
jgi:hypothetical protein